MKIILLFLFLVIPLEIAVTQEDDPTDFLNKVDASKGRVLMILSEKTREYEKQLYDEYMQKIALEEAESNNVIDEIKNLPEYQSGTLAESRRRAARLRQEVEISILPDRAKRMAEDEFYRELRKKYGEWSTSSDYYTYSLNNEDYLFIEAAQPVIEASENPQLERDRIKEAAKYIEYFKNNSNYFYRASFRYSSFESRGVSSVRIEDAYLNIDKYRSIYNDIINEKQREKEQIQAAEKHKKTAIGFGIAFAFLILLVLIYKVSKKELARSHPVRLKLI